MIKTRNLILLVSVLLLAVLLIACGGKADSIRFDKAPRTTYVQGQELDFEGAVITAVKGSKTEQISASDVTVSGYDKNTLGKQTVTFTYGEVSTTLDVTVIARIEFEGAVKDYFVGDTAFDLSKGRIRVANDLGQTTTVALSDTGISVSGFDASKAATGVPVTVSYGGYTGTININVYDVEKVELTSSPKKTEYGSHETVFDVTGAYFTVMAKGTNFARMVELNSTMIKGFDPSVATLENLTTPLKQKVTISYLGNNFDFEISVLFSGVSLVQLRAKELASVTDFANIPEEKGELALDAMRAYMGLDNASKDAVNEADKNLVAKIAVIYGYARFLEEKDVFSETAGLTAVEEESGEKIGKFNIVATSYAAAARDLALLKDENNPMRELGELLQGIKGRFADLEILDGKKTKDYLELLYTADGLNAAVEILTLITDLYKNLENVPTNWKAEDLEAYKSDIKTAVAVITGSEFNPFKVPPYIEVFRQLSKWREKDDYFDIIYAYYLKFETSGVVDTLWQNVPMPEKLQNIYIMLVNAANMTSNISVGGELSEFYYYYREAVKNQKEILEGDNQLHKDIYNKLNLGGLIKSYIFVGNNMNNIGYVYYVSSMVENEAFEELINHYVSVVLGKNTTTDFSDPQLIADVKTLVEMYAALTPAEQYSFICALHCDYRYNLFDGNLLHSEIDDSGNLRASNLFVYVMAKTYREVLSEDAWNVFVKLIEASEVHACRLRDEGKTDAFKDMMASVIVDAAKLSADEKAYFATLLDKMTLFYNECVTPTAPYTGENKAMLDALIDMMNKFFDVSYAMNDSSLSATDKSSMATLWLAIAEKAKSLEEEILASGDENLIHTYLYSIYTFDTDRDDDNEDTDMRSTLNYMMDEIRATQINTLVTMSLADPIKSETTYNGYNLYFDYNLGEVFVEIVDIMYAAYSETESSLDAEKVLATLKSLRNMNEKTMFSFMMFNANAYYYQGVYNCLKANRTDDVADLIFALLSAEEHFIKYSATKTTDDRSLFCDKVETLKAKYEALADKTLFSDFLEMYNYYVKKYESLKNS